MRGQGVAQGGETLSHQTTGRALGRGEGSVVKILSSNVNGLRAVQKKGLPNGEQGASGYSLPRKVAPCRNRWSQTGRARLRRTGIRREKGYSGVLTLTKPAPLKVTRGIGVTEHDREGRVLTTEYDDFFLVNVYVPNAQRSLARLPYRQEWDRDFLAYLKN